MAVKPAMGLWFAGRNGSSRLFDMISTCYCFIFPHNSFPNLVICSQINGFLGANLTGISGWSVRYNNNYTAPFENNN